jgi:hypothetical protein
MASTQARRRDAVEDLAGEAEADGAVDRKGPADRATAMMPRRR